MAEHLAELNKRDLEVYSTTEEVVGVWTDGRPLYRTTISGTKVANTNFVFSLPNVREVVNIRGVLQGTEGSVTNAYNMPYYQASDLYIYVFYNFTPNATFNIVSAARGYCNGPFTAIIEYTKQ